MTVLVVGGGGREHALVWKIAQSPRVKRVLCAPGNAGIAALAEIFPVQVDDFAGLVGLARREKAGLVVIGPDHPLAAGLVDCLQAAGLRAFGPTSAAARFEASKSFAKDFLRRHGIPTASAETFVDFDAARDHARGQTYPLVIKADGLAFGKGVTIAEDFAAAERALRAALVEKIFGEAGRKVLMEEFLRGRECSIHALVDGQSWLLLPDVRDHKRAHDGDEGPNTGGMGALSPSGRIDAALQTRIESEILMPFVRGLRAEGIDFRGVLFPGLMLTADGPKVLELNVRFGDPETQVLLPRLKGDLVDLLESTIDGRLATVRAEWDPRAACCVVMTSAGYPGACRTGFPIEGLPVSDALVFHAGTGWADGRLVTAGGRVLGVTALGETPDQAVAGAYRAVRRIRFENAAWRTDIGCPDPS